MEHSKYIEWDDENYLDLKSDFHQISIFGHKEDTAPYKWAFEVLNSDGELILDSDYEYEDAKGAQEAANDFIASSIEEGLIDEQGHPTVDKIANSYMGKNRTAMPWQRHVPKFESDELEGASNEWEKIVNNEDNIDVYLWDCGQGRCFCIADDKTQFYGSFWCEIDTTGEEVKNKVLETFSDPITAIKALPVLIYEEKFQTAEEARRAFAGWWADSRYHREHTHRASRRMFKTAGERNSWDEEFLNEDGLIDILFFTAIN